MARQEEADRVKFFLQALGRQPRLHVGEPDRFAGGRTAKRKLQRTALVGFVLALRDRHHGLNSDVDARTAVLQGVKGASGAQTLKDTLVDGLWIDAAGKIGKICKRTLATRRHDGFDRLRPDAFERSEGIMNPVTVDVELSA